MNDASNRQFTRVNFMRDVRLDFEGRQYTQHTINDLSLGGMYVKGEFDQQAGDTCTIELTKPEAGAGVELRACCSVVRVTDNGIALEFISMEQESFLFLQTILIYEADDPILLGTEFIKNVSFELLEDK